MRKAVSDMAYIDTNELFKCETCRRYKGDKCLAWCENGECYSPNMKKIPTADVVPKSEVEKLKTAYEGSQKTIKGLTEMIREKNEELAKLETHLELHHGERSLNNLIAKEKSEVAREIFEQIEEYAELQIESLNIAEKLDSSGTDFFGGGKQAFVLLLDRLAELKKKYT